MPSASFFFFSFSEAVVPFVSVVLVVFVLFKLSDDSAVSTAFWASGVFSGTTVGVRGTSSSSDLELPSDDIDPLSLLLLARPWSAN
jgi:hypothetical protein